MNEAEILFEDLNSGTQTARLSALEGLIALENSGVIRKPSSSGSVNNHIHTIYSFSPYSPAKAVWMARSAGLSTAGIMDHDSVGGCTEFIDAAHIAGMATTCGFECRVSVAGTRFEGRRLNNPDQLSVAYVALHGIPHQNLALCEKFLSPFRAHRNERNREMVKKLNSILDPIGIKLDFDTDIVPVSMLENGGSVTERHILYALAIKILQNYGKGPQVAKVLKEKLEMTVSGKVEALLGDTENPYYAYDLLGAMKSGLVPAFYINADEECPRAADFIAFAQKCGGIAAYAYLGDVVSSVTGDKKAQKFEDAFLDDLFNYIKNAGFNAVTYMPSRNTPEQLERLIGLCEKNGLFQISGEDINTPRQSFICPALDNPRYRHLSVSTWALIGHENAASLDIEDAMFGRRAAEKFPDLNNRIGHYAELAQKSAVEA